MADDLAPDPWAKQRVGRVKALTLTRHRGYGFLVGPDGVTHFFFKSEVHPDGVWATLQEGDWVRFTPQPGEPDAAGRPRGPRAGNIWLLTSPPPEGTDAP